VEVVVEQNGVGPHEQYRYHMVPEVLEIVLGDRRAQGLVYTSWSKVTRRS